VPVLDSIIAAYASLPNWRADDLKEAFRSVGEAIGMKLSKVDAPVRVAVTGRTVGPPLFESFELLGRDRTLARLRAAREGIAT
jgi:glutamyl-tRNA synthetase